MRLAVIASEVPIGYTALGDVLPFPLDPRHTVLVVDDEPAIRGVVCEFLLDYGLNPIAAEDADHAIELIECGTRIDLVFSDVRMPGSRDGYGLARWLLEHRPDIPLILVTGDQAKTKAAIGLSGVETFAKPYDFDAAVRKIRDTIRRKRQRAVW